METVLEEHDELGSQSMSAKDGETKLKPMKDSKEYLNELQERDDSGIESKSQSMHDKSQAKIVKSSSETGSDAKMPPGV